MRKKNLKSILQKVNSIALIGASADKSRDSYKVMEFLIEKGYKVYPINPNYAKRNILGQRCYSNLKEIKKKIDMVDIFRSSKFVKEITQVAIDISVDIIWTQEGIFDEESALIAGKHGIIFIMNQCPMKILIN